MTTDLNKLIVTALDNVKGQKVTKLDVTELSDIMDFLIIANGTSNRHVKSLANSVVEDLKEAGIRPIGIEGMETGEWVLVDYGDTVVHVMLPEIRDFYELEKLWSKMPVHRQDKSASAS
jgi:ribosome-associated protein